MERSSAWISTSLASVAAAKPEQLNLRSFHSLPPLLIAAARLLPAAAARRQTGDAAGRCAEPTQVSSAGRRET